MYNLCTFIHYIHVTFVVNLLVDIRFMIKCTVYTIKIAQRCLENLRILANYLIFVERHTVIWSENWSQVGDLRCLYKVCLIIDMTPCIVVEICRRFGGTCCLHIQNFLPWIRRQHLHRNYHTTWRYNLEVGNSDDRLVILWINCAVKGRLGYDALWFVSHEVSELRFQFMWPVRQRKSDRNGTGHLWHAVIHL